LNYLVHASACQAIELVNLVDGHEWGGSSTNKQSGAGAKKNTVLFLFHIVRFGQSKFWKFD
jgi:hypothetical protein